MFKKTFEQKIINGVHAGNGTISFQGVKLNVHCFFVDGVLIDTGAKSLETFFKPFFKQFDIEKVVITHFHEDHTGCASYLQDAHQVPLFMDDTMLDYCRKKANYPIYRQMFWGRRRPFQAQPIGETFHSLNATWRVIKTPGHAVDHLAFLNCETGQLFTGDLYCQEKTKIVLREESVPQIIQSLKKVLTYHFDDVFCSHAGLLNNGRASLHRKLEYLLDLEGTILKLNDEGKNPLEIKKELFPKKYSITLFSTGEMDSLHIIKSILSNDANAIWKS